ncbi:hypothetical protein V6767_18940 [Martelella sp. FLE1502]
MIRQIIGVTGGRAASAGLNLLVSVILLTLLTKDDYGIYYFYYTVIVTAALLPSIAINNGFVLQYQNSHHRSALLSGYLFFELSALALIAAVTVALWLTSTVSGLMALAIVSGMLLAFFDITLNVSRAEQNFTLFSTLQPLRNIATLAAIGVAYVMVQPLNVDSVIWAYLAASLVLAVFGGVQLSAKVHAPPTRAATIELLKGSRRFFVFEISALVLTRVEVWMLQYFSANGTLSQADIAEYGAGFTLAFVFPIISSSVVSVLVTKVAPGKTIGKAGVRKLLVAIGFALLLAMIYALFAYQVSKLVVSDDFTQLHWIIPSVVLGMWMSFCTNIARVGLLSHDADKFANLVYTVQMLGGIAVSFVLTGSLGLEGAVIGFVLIRFFALLLIVARFIQENR